MAQDNLSRISAFLTRERFFSISNRPVSGASGCCCANADAAHDNVMITTEVAIIFCLFTVSNPCQDGKANSSTVKAKVGNIRPRKKKVNGRPRSKLRTISRVNARHAINEVPTNQARKGKGRPKLGSYGELSICIIYTNAADAQTNAPRNAARLLSCLFGFSYFLESSGTNLSISRFTAFISSSRNVGSLAMSGGIRCRARGPGAVRPRAAPPA